MKISDRAEIQVEFTQILVFRFSNKEQVCKFQPNPTDSTIFSPCTYEITKLKPNVVKETSLFVEQDEREGNSYRLLAD